MADLLVIVPSRGRPESVPRLLDAWDATGAWEHAALCFAVDDDDPAIGGYRQHAADRRGDDKLWWLYELPAWVPMVHKLDDAARRYVGDHPALGFAGDDHLPRTAGWARRYLDVLAELGTGWVYGDDGYQGARCPTQWAVTSDIVRALGRMVPAPVEHMYCDVSVLDVGRAAGCIRYLPDVLVEHMHPIAGKAAQDEGYRRVNSSAQFARDRATYVAWKRTGLAHDAAATAALRGETSTMPNVMVAARSGALYHDGRRFNIRRNRTTAHDTHPIVVDNPGLWVPMPVNFPGPATVITLEQIETTTLADSEPTYVDAVPTGDPDEAERKAIRAWAAEQDPPIEVSPRGKIPQAVVDKYRARGPQ